MNTVSLVGSVSRRAGGLFESVRRLQQGLLANSQLLRAGNRKPPGKRQEMIRVSVLGLHDEFSKVDKQEWAPVPVHSFGVWGPRDFGFAPGLTRMLGWLAPELVHVHGLWQYPSLAVSRWHRSSGMPYVVSPHGMLDHWALRNSACKKRLAWTLYERRHLQKASCLRALCWSEVNSIRNLGLTNPICLIPNGVDLAESTPSMVGSEIAELADRKIVLYLGRIHPKKGLAALLRAWAVVERPTRWGLAIVGWDEGGHETELKRLAGDLGIAWGEGPGDFALGASVIFAGPKFGNTKRQWLVNCAAVILPSLSEGVPMAVLEAWAHSKPVLLTPQCNLPEGLAAGAGIGMEPNCDSIAAALRTLLQADESALQSMGARGRTLVRDRFAWPEIASDLRALYLWLRRRGPKPACVVS